MKKLALAGLMPMVASAVLLCSFSTLTMVLNPLVFMSFLMSMALVVPATRTDTPQ